MRVHTLLHGVSNARGYMLIARASKFTRLHDQKERTRSREIRVILRDDDTIDILTLSITDERNIFT